MLFQLCPDIPLVQVLIKYLATNSIAIAYSTKCINICNTGYYYRVSVTRFLRPANPFNYRTFSVDGDDIKHFYLVKFFALVLDLVGILYSGPFWFSLLATPYLQYHCRTLLVMLIHRSLLCF